MSDFYNTFPKENDRIIEKRYIPHHRKGLIKMKKEFDRCPNTIDEAELYGFSWMENVLAIPAPLVLVTSYKENGKQNATMQSWNTFTSENGFYCIFSSVNKHTHMYSSVRQTKECVINFPSKESFMKCMATIQNNGFEEDEITRAGLTAEPATKVNAPRVKECFLNLECEYMWEKDLIPSGDHVVMCVKVVNICKALLFTVPIASRKGRTKLFEG